MGKIIKAFMVMILCANASAKAQDIHLSHIHSSPTYLNPAMNGMFNDGFLRLIANSKSQWNTFTNGYKTAMASADFKMMDSGDAVIATGLQIFFDQAGDLDFTTQKIGLSISGIKSFDRKNRNLVSLGFEGAYVGNRVDFSKAYTFEQDPLVTHYEVPNKIGYFDMSIGVSYFHNFRQYGSMYFGLALAHINLPDVSFSSRIEDQPGQYEIDLKTIYKKVTIHGGADLRLSRYMSVLPSFIFMDQGPHRELTLGSFLKVMKDPSFKVSPYAFYVGAWFRWYAEHDLIGSDALILSFRTDIRRTKIAFSFDLNLSTLTVASNGAGGPEISIIQIIDSQKRRFRKGRVKCPAM